MDEDIKKIDDVFVEETFTRKPHINHTVKYFAELEPVFARLREKKMIGEAYETAMAHLTRNSQHIAAGYVAGLCNFERGDYDDTHLERLLSIFKNIKKWAIVEFLAQKVLEYKETDYALRDLAKYYEVMNREEQAVDILERLVKIDTDNYELPERIAHIKEKEENTEKAVEYYQIALERNIAKRRDRVVETNAKKIMELKPDSLDFFLHIETSLAELLTPDAMIDLWKPMFFHYFEQLKDTKKGLIVIKHILAYEQYIAKANPKKAKFFRHRIEDVYRALYPNHTVFDDFAKIAQLLNVAREPQLCIDAFEKRIQYDVGTYVFHRNFGVGRVKSLTTEDMVIDFAASPGHRMTFEMVLKSVSVLDDGDIKVFKAYRLKELQELAKTSPDKVIELVLKYTIGERISSKDLKHVISPDIIPENNYNKWLDDAKKAIRASNEIKFVKNTFVFKKGGMTYDEEVLDNFERTADFDAKFDIFLNYMNYAKDINCTESREMVSYFETTAGKTPVSYRTVKSIFIINLLKEEYRFVTEGSIDIDSVIEKVDNFVEVYEHLPTALFRERWVSAIIKKFPRRWTEILKSLLYTPQVKNHHIITRRFIQMGKIEVLEQAIDTIILKYNEYTEPFLYFAAKLLLKEFEADMAGFSDGEIKYNRELLLIGLINLIPHLNRMVEKKENTNARKMLKTVYELVFEKGNLITFIETAEKENVAKVFKEFQKLINIENQFKTLIITAVTKRFPDLI
ncbi:MAG: transcript cleavage factor [Spirochaetes bacterium]|nr:transcript cleavage factor [Spirochaetota bacterium]